MDLHEDGEEIVSMNPAHFRTLRELAGLTQADVTAQACVADRTARRWESTHEAPLAVQEWVRDCWRQVRSAAQAIAEARAGDGEVLLTRTPTGWEHDGYWTAGMDAAVARLTLALLELGGAEVTVVSGLPGDA